MSRFKCGVWICQLGANMQWRRSLGTPTSCLDSAPARHTARTSLSPHPLDLPPPLVPAPPQAISLLAWLACEEGCWGPHLIVVPTSVMLNWEMEFKKYDGHPCIDMGFTWIHWT